MRPRDYGGGQSTLHLLLVANTTLLALATLALVMLGTCEVHAMETAAPTAAVGPGAAPVPLRTPWPDFAAQSFYDAHLSFIVAASHPEILARRKVDAAAGFVAPKGRYQALNSTITKLGRGRRKRAGSRGRGGGGASRGNRTRALRLLNVSLATTFSNRTIPLDTHFGGWLDTSTGPPAAKSASLPTAATTGPPATHNRTAADAKPS